MTNALLALDIKNTSNRTIAHHPATYGVPLAQGALSDTKGLAIRLPDGKLRPVQARILERWLDDGSIKWLLLDFDLPLTPNQKGKIELVKEPGRRNSGSHAVKVAEDDRRVSITTPRLEVTISKKKFGIFESYMADGTEIAAKGSDLIVEAPNGKRFFATNAKAVTVKVVEAGPQKVVVESSGRHTADDGSEMLDFRLRYTFRPDEPGVAVSYKFTNREEPEQGVQIKSIQAVFPTATGNRPTKHIRQVNTGEFWFARAVSVEDDVELIASGSINPSAKTIYGSASEGKVVIRNFEVLGEDLSKYPYYLRPGNARTDMSGGLKQVFAYVGLSGKEASVVAWFNEMGQNFPKGVRTARNVITFDVWPAWATELRWRRGMSKEHDLYICGLAGPKTHEELESVYLDHELPGVGIWGQTTQALQLTLDPAYVRSTKVLDLHRYLPYDDAKYPIVEAKMGTLSRSHTAPQMGMMDYGDYVNADRSWCHNNENDAILNSIREYYRKTDYVCLLEALIKARHNAHVDFIAHDPDPLRQGTMPAHCPDHTDGAAYPSHMWVDGLLAAYCLTGNEDFRDAALSVGANMRRWQKDRKEIFYADSRECGWPMLAYLRLHEHTGDGQWLEAAREVFEFYLHKVDENAQIQYELPHGIGFFLGGYGEFIAWRSCFFYWERTGQEDVKRFLTSVLEKVYRVTYDRVAAGGWACNDFFPAWAAYQITGDEKYFSDNREITHHLLTRSTNLPWGGVDVMYYFHELDRRGELEAMQK